MEIKKTVANKKKSGKALDVESLDACEVDDEGFIDGDVDFGVPIVTFNFGKTPDLMNCETIIQKPKAAEVPSVNTTVADQNNNPSLRGATPPIDGEYFTLKRGYQLRPSTLRKLNELKAKHPNVNVYLNTILDAAIRHYYEYIFHNNGQF